MKRFSLSVLVTIMSLLHAGPGFANEKSAEEKLKDLANRFSALSAEVSALRLAVENNPCKRISGQFPKTNEISMTLTSRSTLSMISTLSAGSSDVASAVYMIHNAKGSTWHQTVQNLNSKHGHGFSVEFSGDKMVIKATKDKMSYAIVNCEQ